MHIWIVSTFCMLKTMFSTFALKSLCGLVFISQEYNFWVICQLQVQLLEKLPNCFPKFLHHFTFPAATGIVQMFQFFHILTNHYYCVCFYYSHLNECEVLLDLHFRNNYYVVSNLVLIVAIIVVPAVLVFIALLSVLVWKKEKI